MKKVYQIVLKRSVLKEIRRIPGSILRNIQERIALLAEDPMPPGVEPVHGYNHHYRIRIGNYRVVYEVAASIRIITIVRVAHRKDVYKSL